MSTQITDDKPATKTLSQQARDLAQKSRELGLEIAQLHDDMLRARIPAGDALGMFEARRLLREAAIKMTVDWALAFALAASALEGLDA